MKIKSRNHVYECLPPFYGNRKAKPDDQYVIGLKGVTKQEDNDFRRDLMNIRTEYAVDVATGKIDERIKEMAKDHVVFIKGLEIDGVENLDFDSFYKEAPKELIDWVENAVMSTEVLMSAERKNFLPESVSV